MSQNLDEKVDQLEAATDPNTVISIGGYSFTPAKLMIAFTIVSSSLGALYGAFEIYKDYQSMKEAIQTYVTPDLSEFDKRLSVIEENSQKTADYTRDIKNDLNDDIRRTDIVLEQVERGVKQTQRETDQYLKTVSKEVNSALQRNRDEIEKLKRDVDSKIQKALDNPLAGN
jgi:uncharacterized protein YoxC